MLALLLPLGLFAQDTSQVSGVVTDGTGVVIPNANLELQNVDTGLKSTATSDSEGKYSFLKRTATSDSEGKYSFLRINPGQYTLTAGAAGFRSTTISALRLLVNNPATVNIRMEVGQMTESVTVSAEAVYINTTDASIGNAIGTIVELPPNARNMVLRWYS